jgi:hypothetical protein
MRAHTHAVGKLRRSLLEIGGRDVGEPAKVVLLVLGELRVLFYPNPTNVRSKSKKEEAGGEKGRAGRTFSVTERVASSPVKDGSIISVDISLFCLSSPGR